MYLPSRLQKYWVTGRALVGGERFSGVERFFGALDPDVARAFERLDEGDEFAVRGDLRARNFRIAEEQFAINQRRVRVGLSECRTKSQLRKTGQKPEQTSRQTGGG